MKIPHWQIELVDADTGETLKTAIVACSTAAHAHEKARFRWGIGHKVLIGTDIRVIGLGMRDIGQMSA